VEKCGYEGVLPWENVALAMNNGGKPMDGIGNPNCGSNPNLSQAWERER